MQVVYSFYLRIRCTGYLNSPLRPKSSIRFLSATGCLNLTTSEFLADGLLLMHNGSVQNNRGIFLYRALYCSSKKFNGVNAPSDLATTITDCSGLDMLSRES